MFGFFGAPISFENNAERALELAIAVDDAVKQLQDNTTLEYRMGITSGTAYTGIVGGKERCQYAAVGNQVNLAARLMTYAGWGEILVGQEIQKNRHFSFNEHKKPGIAYIYGEAGIGKSRICYELKKDLQEESKIACFTCQADQILQKPFNPFVYFLRTYFGQSPENNKIDNRLKFEQRFQWILNDIGKIEHEEAKELYLEISRTRSVLAAQIGIHYPDSLWEQLDAKGRYQNILFAIITLFKAESLIRPVLIELEDGHWYDDNSIELVNELIRQISAELIRQISAYPIFLLVTSRYLDDGTKPSIIKNELLAESNAILYYEVDLNILQPKVLRNLATTRLGGVLSHDCFELFERLTKVDNEWVLKDQSIRVSSSINSVLMARIDRLSDLVKETVKAAAVIGREFELPVLTEVMQSHHQFVGTNGNSNVLLTEQIKTAEKGQIWRAMNELRYIFKHSIMKMQIRKKKRFIIQKKQQK